MLLTLEIVKPTTSHGGAWWGRGGGRGWWPAVDAAAAEPVDLELLTSFIDGTDSPSDALLREISACFAGALGLTPLPGTLQ